MVFIHFFSHPDVSLFFPFYSDCHGRTRHKRLAGTFHLRQSQTVWRIYNIQFKLISYFLSFFLEEKERKKNTLFPLLLVLCFCFASRFRCFALFLPIPIRLHFVHGVYILSAWSDPAIIRLPYFSSCLVCTAIGWEGRWGQPTFRCLPLGESLSQLS